jgi:hypothetical protein
MLIVEKSTYRKPGRAVARRLTQWLVAVVMIASAAMADAQVIGLYYQETEKDGRIYVFNTPERFKMWQASGEIGTSVTLIGRGPNGETLVGENETAIDLFLFRHELPAYDRPTPKPTPTPVVFPQVKVGGLAYISYQDGTSGGKDYAKTVLKRGYLNVDAKILPYLSARITPDVTQDSTGDWKVRLKYLYGKFDLGTASLLNKNYVEFGLAHMPWLDFEEHINLFRLQDTMFMERNGLFNSADVGVMWGANLGADLPDDYMKKVNKAYAGRWGSVQVGVYDGGGYHATEANTSKVVECRITVRPLPDVLPGFQVTYFGISGKGNTAAEPDWTSNTGLLSYESEHAVVTGQYVDGKGDQGGKAVDAAGKALPRKGWSGYVEGRLTPAWSVIGRYDEFDPNSDAANDKSQRRILGVAYKFNSSNMLLLDYDEVKYDQAGKPKDKRAQITLQLSF